jgi:nucleolin
VRQQQWSIASFQRRFTSNDAAKTEAEKAAAEAPDNFAQTAAEAPVEDGLTPAQQDAQAEPTNAADTIGADGLEQLTKAANGNNSRRRANDNPPNKTLYIGNLYYEVTTEQLQRVFTRFGEVESVKIVYDNRGLSRG